MKVLLIGGTGTISNAIGTKLAADPNVDLYLLLRGGNFGHRDELPDTVHRIFGDYRTEGEKIREMLAGEMFDAVAHFHIYNEEDAKKAYAIFRGLTKQFIYISTNVVLNHTLGPKINEKVATGNSLSVYGTEKRQAEEFLQSVSGEDFPLTVVRPSHTYSRNRLPLGLNGTKSNWSVVSRMLRGKKIIMHGDGQSIWPVTHSTDFAEWFCPILGNPVTIGETYHIMNPNPTTWDQIYQALAETYGVEFKPVYISTFLLENSKVYSWHDALHGDKYFSNLFDCSKVAALNPGFTAQVDIKKGCEMFKEYMELHPEDKIEDPEFDAWCDMVIEKYEKLKEEFIKDI